LFKAGSAKVPSDSGKVIAKSNKLFISSNEKPINPVNLINSTIATPSNYDVGLFSAINKSDRIHGKNLKILKHCRYNEFLQKHQQEELVLLSKSTSNMLIHSALVHKGEAHLSFVIKTSKDKYFYYMSDDSVGIKESSVSNYMLENGEASYISGVIYRTCRTAASENVFDSLQNDLVKLAYFQYTTPNVATMIASYKKIVNVVYINKLVKPNFYDYYHLCDIVYGNYTKCAITKGQWEEFFS
jgi:hypothetical protein